MRRHVIAAIRLLALGIVLALVTGAEPAYAFNQDWGGLEDDWSMPTRLGTNPPTTTQCIARKSNNQQCKGCADTYYDSGVKKPYQVCAWWAMSFACSCSGANTSNCVSEGSCTYYG